MKTFFFNPALRSKSPTDSSETPLSPEGSSSDQSKESLQDQDIEYKLALDDFQNSRDLKELGFNYSGKDELLSEFDFISQEYLDEIIAGQRQIPDDEEGYNIFLKKLKVSVLKKQIDVSLYYNSELLKDDKIFDILFVNSELNEKNFNEALKKPHFLINPHYYRIFLKSLKKSVSEKLLDFTEDHLIWASQRANEGYPEILEIMSGNHFMEKQQFADIVENKISIPQDPIAFRIFLAKLKNSVSSRKIELNYDDLLWATKNGFYDILKTLFDSLSYYEKTEKYVFDKDQRTLLHHYVLNEYGIVLTQKMVELLIDNRVPLNSFDCNAKTALQYAISKDNYELFMFLIDRNFWKQETSIKTRCTVSEGFKEKKNCLDSVIELIESRYSKESEDKKKSVILKYTEPVLASGILILNPFNISNPDHEELETFFVRINFIGNFFNLLCQDKAIHDKDSEDYRQVVVLLRNLMRNYFNSFIMLRLIDADQESFKNILLIYCPIEEAIEQIFPGQLFSQKIESRELREIILQTVKESEINYSSFILNPWIDTQEKLFSLCPDLAIAIDRSGSAYKVDERLDQETFCISPLNYCLVNDRFVTALELVSNGFDPNQIDSKGNLSTAYFIKDYCEKFRDDIKKFALKHLAIIFVNQNLSIYPKFVNESVTDSKSSYNLSFICFDFFAEYARVIFGAEKNKNFILIVDQDATLAEDTFKNFKYLVSFYYEKYFSLYEDCPLEVVFDKVGSSELSSKRALELSLELNKIFQKCRSPLRTGFLVKNIYFDKTLNKEFCETFIPEYPEGKYQGQIQRGVPHGEGTISFDGGLTCFGSFSNGFLNGFATFTKTYLGKKKKNETLVLYFVNGVCTYLREDKIYELAESPFLKIKHANFIDTFRPYESKFFLFPSDGEYRSYLAQRTLKLEESLDSTISLPSDYIEKIQQNFFMFLTNNFLVFKDFNDAKALLKFKSKEALLIAKEKKDSLLKLIAEKQTKLARLKSKELLSKSSSSFSQSIEKIEKELPFYFDLLANIDGHIKLIGDYSLSSAIEMSKSYQVKFLVDENDPMSGYHVCESLYSAQKDLKKFLKCLASNEQNFICKETYLPIGLGLYAKELFPNNFEQHESGKFYQVKPVRFLENFISLLNTNAQFFKKFDLYNNNFGEEEINLMQFLVAELSSRNLIHFEEKLVELEHVKQDQQQTSEVQGSHNRFEDIIKEFDDNLQKIKTKLLDIDQEIKLIVSVVKHLIESNQSLPQKPVEQPSSYLNLFSRFLENRSASVVQLSESDDYSEDLKNALLGIVKIKVRNEILIDSLQVDDYDDFKVGSAYLISQEQINELFETIERDSFRDQEFLRSLTNYYKKENPNYVDKVKHYFHYKFEELMQKCLEEKGSKKHKENFKRRIYNFLKFCHVKDSLEIENLDADYHRSDGLGHATGASLDELKKSIFLLNKLQNIANQKVSLAQYLEKLQDVVFNKKEDLQFSDKKQKFKEKLIELSNQSYLENLFMSLQSIAKRKSEFKKISEEFKSEFVNFYLPYCFMLSEIYQIDSIAKEEDRCFMKSDLEKIQKIEQLKLSELNGDKDSIDFTKLFGFLKENPEILKIINNFALTLDIQNVDLLEKIEIAHDVFAKFSSDTESVDRYQVKNEDHYNVMRSIISSYFEEGYLMRIGDFKRKNSAFLDRDKTPSAFELMQSDRSLEKASQSPAKTKQDSSGVSQAKTTAVAEAKPDPRPVPKASPESAKQGKAKQGKEGRGKA